MNNLPAAQTPFDTLTEALGGLMVGHCLTAVTNFRVADALGDTPQTAAELAAATGTNPEALRRMLRLLAAHGVFAYTEDRFARTAASQLLRGEYRVPMRDFVAYNTEPRPPRSTWATSTTRFIWVADPEQGEPGRVLRPPPRGDPGFGQLFNAAMTAKARLQIASIVTAYDFPACAAIADIGGGLGHLLQAVLDAAPEAAGVLFDLPPVIEAAAAAVTGRLRLQAGDFFKDPLPAADTYLIMDVIHDWDDEQTTALLSAVRNAALPHARV